MAKKVTIVVFAVLLAAASLADLFFGDTAVAQARHMRQARGHLPVVTQTLSARQEFAHVTTGVGTGAGGSILVTGRVASRSDLETLRQCIASTQPPVTVTYSVSVSQE